MPATAPSRTALRIGRGAGLGVVALAVALTAACSSTPSDADRTPAVTTTVTATPTPAGTPAAEPTGTPTATAGATGPAFALDDPTTWTVSGDEVGPIALGGAVAGEVDDLDVAYDRNPGACPASPATTFWDRSGAPGLIVEARDGRVSGVAITAAGPGATVEGGPTTAAGAGIGTSLEDLQTTYPDLRYSGTYGEERGQGSHWSIPSGSRFVTFTLGSDGAADSVWVGDTEQPPYEYCG